MDITKEAVPANSNPPTYQETVVGVKPVGLFLPNSQLSFTPTTRQIFTTVVPTGTKSIRLVCPNCNAQVDTVTRTEPSLNAYLSGMLCALSGCILGCCLIPFCVNECMDVHHICPNCREYLGIYRR